MKKVLLKDIANAAGVSVALVSYVVNNKTQSHRVNIATAQRINQIAQELGYRPNSIARSLRSGKSHTLGVVLSDISNPFFAHLARCIEDAAAQEGYTVLFGSSDESVEKMDILIENLWSKGVDGLIVVPCEGSLEYLKLRHDRGIPIVLLDRGVPGLNIKGVCLNNNDAGYMATRHLLESGYKQPAMIAYQSDLSNMSDRIAGYQRAMQEAGLSKSATIIRWKMHMEESEIEEDLEDLLHAGKDAIVFSTNTLAFKGLPYFVREQIRIPQQLGVVCFDESEAFLLFQVPLTYIKQPIKDLAFKSVQSLLERLNTGVNDVSIHELGAELVVQKSSTRLVRTSPITPTISSINA